MLQWIGNLIGLIVDGVTSLVDGIRYIVDTFVSFVSTTVWLVTYIGDIASNGNFLKWFDWLPELAYTLVIACVAIAVVFKIFGREG